MDEFAGIVRLVLTEMLHEHAGRFSAQLDRIERNQETIMTGLADIQSAQTTLHADLEAETGLIKQLLTAFANGTLTPAAAQALVDGMTADDATAKGNIAAIQAALTPAPPAPAQ